MKKIKTIAADALKPESELTAEERLFIIEEKLDALITILGQRNISR